MLDVRPVPAAALQGQQIDDVGADDLAARAPAEALEAGVAPLNPPELIGPRDGVLSRAQRDLQTLGRRRLVFDRHIRGDAGPGDCFHSNARLRTAATPPKSECCDWPPPRGISGPRGRI